MQVDNIEPINASGNGTYVKICDCGRVNIASAIFCESCGEDLSYIYPILQEHQSENQSKDQPTAPIIENKVNAAPKEDKEFSSFTVRLTSCDKRYSCIIKEDICILGRKHFMSEYLKDCSFVSKTHAEIIKLPDGAIVVKDLDSTNGTFVNGIRVDGISGVRLSNGDLLSLGGIVYKGKKDQRAGYFEIQIKSSSASKR